MFSQLQAIGSIMRGNRLRYCLALACVVLATFLAYGVPLIGSVTIDYAVGGKVVGPETPALIAAVLRALGGAEHLRTHLWLAPVAMVLLSLASGIFNYLKGWQASLASDGIARQLKDQLYDHLNHLPARHHDRAETGDLVQRCTSDVETARQFLAAQVMEIGTALILAVTALPLLVSLSVPMTLVSFSLIGPLIFYAYFYFRKVKQAFKDVDEAEGALTAVIQENLTGIRVVRAFARQEFERAKFAVPNALYRDRSLRLIRLMSWYWSISDVVALCQLGLTLLVGAQWIVEGRLTVGMLFAFMSYLSIMLWPLRQMGRILTDLGKTAVALTRIREILAVQREADSAPVAPAPPPETDLAAPITGRISVRDLHFHHAASGLPVAGRGALNGVSFDIQPGESLAILGPSGSGKSTLLHLLLRLYDYSEGSIRFDGRELSSLPRKWLRAQVGVVMQEPFLFSKTLRDNLRLGRGDAPDQEIEAAARAASIHDTILSFEQGYNTLIGERGITLSGGQRQRVAIARAVLKRPPLLILDDAMSAIDAETESIILDALRERRGRATTLVIAHRLSTLAHADRVIVLDHGRIIQTGTHAELSAQDGLYRRLWQIQTNVEDDFKTELKPA
ncbi:MAG: transporter related [Verrucomicrobia bacterium]|nr:transporter related [Verrucomicrobiota bacterium]